MNQEDQLQALLAQLNGLVSQVQRLPHSESWQEQLEDVRKRILAKQQQVSIFGAFSAGKSSLINALLGESVLAVSPNPTTASITHVETKQTLQSQAVVTIKTETQMWMDVEQALLQLHLTAPDFAGAFALVRDLDMKTYSPVARKFIAFLQAAASGFDQVENKFGATFQIAPSEIHRYTADERTACYVQKVRVAHEADLLDEGIVLVDTPGVDSIHRRHTDVAFEYMRSADAVVFVLYYTHAFTRTDRDFFQQLAGVQDVVHTNKLFVVINAVDLASSEDERTDVRKRVENELKVLGIRSPRIYEVSSQLYTGAKSMQDDPENGSVQSLLRQRLNLSDAEALPEVSQIVKLSGVPKFKDELIQFVETESLTIAMDTVARSMRRVYEELLSYRVLVQEQRNRTETAQAMHLTAVRDQQFRLGQVKQQIMSGQAEYVTTLSADWDELDYHIAERIRLVFSTLFKESFYPGRFRARTNPREQLRDAAEELAQALNRQIETECRTFALRAQRGAIAVYEQFSKDVRQNLTHVHVPTTQIYDLDPDDIPVEPMSRRAELSGDLFKETFRHFSSTKQFFEGNGQNQMKIAAETIALSAVKEIVTSLLTDIRVRTLGKLQVSLTQAIDQALVLLTDTQSFGLNGDLAALTDTLTEVLLEFERAEIRLS
jgi:tRNA U34 5-carboxymethylaminomethyl modifying GTPase MnmE/TrmE